VVELFFMEIYCDLDQVLVNFLGGARNVLSKEFNDPSLGEDSNKWTTIRQVPRFWRDLDWMPNAQALWAEIKPYNPWILTATPSLKDAPNCAAQKIEWCVSHLEIPVHRIHTVRRREKRTFSGPSKLLIDDHKMTYQEWSSDGGIAIWHQTVPETINLVQHHLRLQCA
jgi:FMN phosphatase YigB (HAD superfamily)